MSLKMLNEFDPTMMKIAKISTPSDKVGDMTHIMMSMPTLKFPFMTSEYGASTKYIDNSDHGETPKSANIRMKFYVNDVATNKIKSMEAMIKEIFEANNRVYLGNDNQFEKYKFYSPLNEETSEIAMKLDTEKPKIRFFLTADDKISKEEVPLEALHPGCQAEVFVSSPTIWVSTKNSMYGFSLYIKRIVVKKSQHDPMMLAAGYEFEE